MSMGAARSKNVGWTISEWNIGRASAGPQHCEWGLRRAVPNKKITFLLTVLWSFYLNNTPWQK